MSQNPTDVTDLVRSLVEQIVDEPEAVAVDYVTCGSDEIEVQITVAEGDIGKVIGRQGRIAKEIRTIIKSVAQREGQKVSVEIVD